MALLDGILAAIKQLSSVVNLGVEVIAAKQDVEWQAVQRIEKAVEELRQPRIEPKYMKTKDAAMRYGMKVDNMREITKMPEAPLTLKVGQLRLLPIAEYDAFMVAQYSDKDWSKV